MCSPPVDQPQRRNQLPTEEQIFGNREMLHQRKILIDDAHAQGPRGLRITKLDRSAVDADFAGVGPVEPGHDLDQRALARAVGAEQGMHFATPHVEVYIVERHDAWECLAQAAQFEDHLARRGGRPNDLRCHRDIL